MVSAGAIPDLIADLPDHTPPGLENLMPVPEGFGHTPASPSTPSACQLQQLPYTPEVQHRPKASSPLVPRRQLFTVIHSDKVNDDDTPLRIHVRRSMLPTFNDTETVVSNKMTDQDIAVLGILFANWDSVCKCEARNQPVPLKSAALLKIVKTHWRGCGVSGCCG